MGKGSSSSRQESITQAAETSLEMLDGQGVALSNVRGDAAISIHREGVEDETLINVGEIFATAAGQVAETAQAGQQQTAAALEDIARAQAAGQTETGRLIEVLALPVVVVIVVGVAILAFFWR